MEQFRSKVRFMTAAEDIFGRRENAHFEAKLAKGGLPGSLWETYSAFANTDGGTIALGVKELSDGTLDIAGVEAPEKLVKAFWDVINDRKKVSLNILSNGDVSVEVIDGKRIVLIRVPRAERSDRPVFINNDMLGGTFRRNGEGDYHCPRDEVRTMLRDAEGKSQDLNLVSWATSAVFDMESVHRYRNRMQVCRPGHVWQSLNDETFLLRIGALGHDDGGVLRPTRAGLLMFGSEYEIVREFPVYFLDYQEKFDADTRWTDRIYSSSGEWSGNVFDFFFMAYNRIAQTLKVPFKLVGMDRIDDTPVHKAIREALANCLVNSDYYLPRGVVVIRDRESISLSNPGGFRVPIATAMSGGVSDPRNATMLKMFNLIDIGERTGSGIPLIRATWESQTWPDIKASESFNPERTTIVLSLRYSDNGSLNDAMRPIVAEPNEPNVEPNEPNPGLHHDGHEIRIMEMLRQDSLLTIPEMASRLNVSRETVKRLLNKLKAAGSLVREGGTRGCWRVLKS